MKNNCLHCGREVVFDGGKWVDAYGTDQCSKSQRHGALQRVINWCSICDGHRDHGTMKHCTCPQNKHYDEIEISPDCPVHEGDYEYWKDHRRQDS